MVAFAIKLFYQNQSCQAFPVTQQQLEPLALCLLQHLPLPLTGTVNVNVINATQMQTIAKTHYPFKARPADVLSFRYAAFAEVDQTNSLLGEVFLSWPQIQVQARLFKHSLHRESRYLLLHGLLHLLGYDHQTELSRRIMRYWEEFFLTFWNQSVAKKRPFTKN